MISRRLRLWLAVILLIVTIVILMASFLPAPRFRQVLPVPPVILPTPTRAALEFSPVDLRILKSSCLFQPEAG